jgi:hypothetical protein
MHSTAIAIPGRGAIGLWTVGGFGGEREARNAAMAGSS